MTAPSRFKTGRIKNDPTKPRIRLFEYPAGVAVSYTPPETLDYYSRIPAASWGMDGNGPDPTNPPDVPEGAGDCTFADVDHEVKSDEVVAGNAEVNSTATEVLAAYEKVTGYKPSDPSTDQGAQMQDVRTYWRKSGITLGGQIHKILMFAELTVSNHALVQWFLDRCGTVGFGINFPDSAMTQFNNGQPWDVVPGEPDPTDGHAIAFVGWNKVGPLILTWGKVQQMTWAFYDKYVEEVWGSLSADFINEKAGTDEFGETLYQLGQQFASITNEPNPVPAPSPAPPPFPQAPHRGLLQALSRFLHRLLPPWRIKPI